MQNILVYKIAADEMLKFKSSPSSATVKNLSSSECVELVKSGVCERFLRRFVVDYVPSANGYFAPVPLIEADLLELLKVSVVMVTYEGDGDHEISSLSFAESLLLKTKSRSGQVKAEVQYFGSRLDDFTEHARAHLNHSVRVVRGRNFTVVFNFPTCIDRETASATVSETVTRGLKNLETPPTAYVLSTKLPKRPRRASVAKPNL